MTNRKTAFENLFKANQCTWLFGFFVFGVYPSSTLAATSCDFTNANAYAQTYPGAPGSVFTMEGWICATTAGDRTFLPVTMTSPDGTIPQSMLDTAFDNGEACSQLVGQALLAVYGSIGDPQFVLNPPTHCQVVQQSPLPWYNIFFSNSIKFTYISGASAGYSWTVPQHYGPRVFQCPSDQQWNNVLQRCEAKCPIDPLPNPVIPIADEEAWRFERANGKIFDYDNLSNAMKTALACMERDVPPLGGTTHRESGYRPPGYQLHLQQVWDKNKEINKKLPDLSDPQKQACAALITQVRNEMSTHRPRFRPASGSCHEQKPACAFDLQVTMFSGDKLDTYIDFAAGGCGLRRFNIYNDPNHFSGR